MDSWSRVTARHSRHTSRTPANRAPSGIELPTYAVLDAKSGKPLTEVHTDGTALAVNADQLLVAEGKYVVAHGVSNPTHWRTRLECTVTQGVLLADQAVVVDACDDNHAVVRGLDLETGKQLWEADLGIRFELSAELDPTTWVGDMVAVPDSREVSGLVWTGAAGGTLYQWAVDVGEGRVICGNTCPRYAAAATRSVLLRCTARCDSCLAGRW